MSAVQDLVANRAKTMSAFMQGVCKFSPPTIIEVGRVRQIEGAYGDGYSTVYFGKALASAKGKLLSIDIDPETELVAKALMAANDIPEAAIEFVTADALAILPFLVEARWRGVSGIYLDGLDCDTDAEKSALWHLSCFSYADILLAPGGWLLIDDCMDAVTPSGKGWLVVPAAEAYGYEVVLTGYQWLLGKP